MGTKLLEESALRRVYETAIAAGLAEKRSLAMDRLPNALRASLPREHRSDADHLDADLHALNGQDRLRDGRHPLEIWLAWASGAASLAAHRDVFAEALGAPARGAKLERSGLLRLALTIHAHGEHRRYQSGGADLLTLDDAPAAPPGPGAAPADLFDWLVPPPHVAAVFRALAGTPYPTRHAVTCRVVGEAVDGLPPLFPTEWKDHPLVTSAAPWTLELGFDAEPTTPVRLTAATMSVALIAAEARRAEAEALRSLLSARSVEFHSARRCAIACAPPEIDRALGEAQPQIIVLLGPGDRAVRAVGRWMAARGKRTPLLLCAPDGDAAAAPSPDAVPDVSALVRLGAAGDGCAADVVRGLLKATALEGVDPVEALHRLYRDADDARRGYLESAARVWTRFSTWSGERVAPRRRLHPRTALDRIHQRQQVTYDVQQDQLPNGRRLQIFICSGGPGTDLAHLSRVCVTALRGARLEVVPVSVRATRSDQMIRRLADALESDADDARGLSRAIDARRPESAERPYLWLDLGCHATARADDLAATLRVIVDVALQHPWPGRLPVGVFVGLHSPDAEAAEDLAAAVNPERMEDQRIAYATAVAPLSPTVKREDLRRYFLDQQYSPDTVERASSLVDAVWAHIDKSHEAAVRCIRFGVQCGWEELERRLKAVAPGADPFADRPLDDDDVYFDLGGES